MKQLLLILGISLLVLSCKKKDEEPQPWKDPSFIYAKTVTLYYNEEIPEGGIIYIDDISFTTKDFPGATKDTGRFDLDNWFVSTTNRYEGATVITDFDKRMFTAGNSLCNSLIRYNNTISNDYSITPQADISYPAYTKFKISAKKGELRIKTENYPVKITVIQ